MSVHSPAHVHAWLCGIMVSSHLTISVLQLTSPEAYSLDIKHMARYDLLVLKKAFKNVKINWQILQCMSADQ